MKIRTDFVTNSSSSSFTVVLEITLKNGEEIYFSGTGATPETGSTGDFDGSADVSLDIQQMGTAKSVDELIYYVKHGIKDSGQVMFGDGNYFIRSIRKNIKSPSDIKTIMLEVTEENYVSGSVKYTYDVASGRLDCEEEGEFPEDIDGSHGGSLNIRRIEYRPEPPKKKGRYKEDYSIDGGYDAWEALLETYKKPLPSFPFIPFSGGLMAAPDLLWFEYSNPVIDELVKKYNYENKHFEYNNIDCYDEILFNRVIASTWFGREDADDPNVMDPFPFYGSDDIEDFSKSLLSLLIITGEPNEGFKKEAIERVQEIAKAFLKIDAGFVKNVMEDYTEFNERIDVEYDGTNYEVSKFIFEGGY